MANQKIKLMGKLSEYLKSHNIHYQEYVDNGTVQFAFAYQGYDNCPDRILESCIWFYENEMEVRVYYDENASGWCKGSEHKDELMGLLNYINASVWIHGTDGMNGLYYKGQYLYTPRLYMTEDGCYDITLTTVIPYDFYEVAPLETEDYITAACPELMDKFSKAIFLLLLGEIDIEQAKTLIKQNVMEK